VPEAPAIPASLSWGTLAPVLICLLVAVRYAPWWRLAARDLQHVYLGAMVVVLLLWSMRAGLSTGLAIHLLGMTALTLMWGRALALVAAGGACLGLMLAGIENLSVIGLEYLCAGMLPVLVSWQVLRLVERRLPGNLFVYLFVAVFAGAALATVSGSLLRAALLGLAGVHETGRLIQEYLALLPLFALPEALLNGFIMTLLVVYRPRWVLTFDDDRYLGRR
jgi:uncharacterized membrane protein